MDRIRHKSQLEGSASHGGDTRHHERPEEAALETIMLVPLFEVQEETAVVCLSRARDGFGVGQEKGMLKREDAVEHYGRLVDPPYEKPFRLCPRVAVGRGVGFWREAENLT